MSNVWRIHSFHISVPLGDAAIHLLVDEAKALKKPEIHSAVLIDGGRRGKKVLGKLQTVIGFIENNYTLDKSTDHLRFDSIVITHWDLDHYDGVINLLNAGSEKTLERWPPESTPSAYESLWVPNWYCKYADGASPKPSYQFFSDLPDTKERQKLLATCLTTLYVPYSMGNVKPNASGELNKVKSGGSVQYEGRAGPFGVQGSAGGNFVIRGCYENAAANPGPVFASLGPSKEKRTSAKPLYLAFARLVDSPKGDNGYLGRNLFNPSGVDGGGDPSKAEAPHDLLAMHKLTSREDRPGFFIVAGFQRVIGDKTLVTEDKAKDAADLPPFNTDSLVTDLIARIRKAHGSGSSHAPQTLAVQDEKVASLSSGSIKAGEEGPRFFRPTERVIVEHKDELGTEPKAPIYDDISKNAASIVAMALAATGASQPRDQFGILSYSGGDALWDVECALGHWLTDQYGSRDNLMLPAMVMKLSHHGAKGSTPVNLLNVLYPHVFLSSCAPHDTKKDSGYGHPSFELAIMLYALRRMWKTLNAKIIQGVTAQGGPAADFVNKTTNPAGLPIPQLVCTNFPRWASNQNDIFAVTIDYLKSTNVSTAARYFHAAVASRLPEGTGNDGLLGRIFIAATGEPGSARNQIRNILRKDVWPDLGFNQGDWDLAALRIRLGLQDQGTQGWFAIERFSPDDQRLIAVYNLPQDFHVVPAQAPPALEEKTQETLALRTANTTQSAASSAASAVEFTTLPQTNQSDPPVAPGQLGSVTVPDDESMAPVDLIENPDGPYDDNEAKEDILDDEHDDWAEDIVMGNEQPGPGEPVSVSHASVSSSQRTAVARTVDVRGAIGPSPQPFFLLSRDYRGIVPGPDQGFLIEDSPFESFTLLLPNAFVVADRDPNASAGAEQLAVVNANDGWGQLVCGDHLNITSIALALTITAPSRTASPADPPPIQTAQVAQVGAALTLGSQELNFSSDDAPTMLGLSPHVSAHRDPFFIVRYGLLALGLSASVTSLPLSSVIDLLAPLWLKDPSSPTALILDSTIQALNLTLDLNTGPGSRNGLFFRGDRYSTTYLRLQFDLTAGANDVIAWLKRTSLVPLGDISVGNLSFTCLKCATSEMLGGIRSSKVVSTLTWSGSIFFNGDVDKPIQFWLVFKSGETKFVLRFPDWGGVSAEDIFSWLRTTLLFDADTSPELKQSLSQDKIQALAPVKTSAPSGSFSVAILQVEVDVGSASGFSCLLTLQLNVFGTTFLTTFSFPRLRVRADLWTFQPTSDPLAEWVPWYEQYMTVTPSGGVAAGVDARPLSLTTLTNDSGDSTGIPDPPDPGFLSVRRAYFEAEELVPGVFHAELAARVTLKGPSTTDIPLVLPRYFELRASGDKQGRPATTQWDLELSTSLYLPSRTGVSSLADLASLELTISRTNKAWKFAGKARDIDFGAMYGYFDPDAKQSAMDLLEGIGISFFDLTYVHGPEESRDLQIEGAFVIKSFELAFTYHYWKQLPEKVTKWTFEASLGPESPTGGDIAFVDFIGELVPGDNSGILQSLREIPFVSDISVATETPGSSDNPIVFGLSNANPSNAMVMFLDIKIKIGSAVVSALFVQRKTKGAAPTSGSKTASKTDGLKRYIRVRLDNLPKLPNIPVIGQIDAPVDSIDYVYVQDPSVPGAAGGLTAAEIAEMNAALQDVSGAAIGYREAQSAVQAASRQHFEESGSGPSGSPPGSKPAASAGPALRNGHHFIVTTDGKVVLDHRFGSDSPPAPSPSPSPAMPAARALVVAQQKSDATDADSGATMGAQKKSLGPLTIHNVGLQVKDKHVYVLIDGDIMLGAIKLTLQGFGVGIPLDEILHPLYLLEHPELFSFVLSGLGVLYDVPPTLIAGGFKHEDTPAYEGYLGGLLVTIPPYAITAVGAYRHTKQPDFRSVFLFGRLAGPLLTLEFAEITGVAVSFGYNYNLRTPTGATLENFPLLTKKGPGTTSGDPLDLIAGSDPSSFASWLTALQDTYFFSLGLKADSFEILTLEAAVVFEMGGGSPKISLVGRGTAVLPPTGDPAKKPPVSFMYAEMGLVATLDLAGSMIVEAQLSSNSYVMNPLCHVRGGCALAYWFGDSPHAGDWVFTLGGYHPAFKPAPHWPVPPRLGMAWDVSDELSVGGEAFFAITPHCVMGGGRLLANFSAGPVRADFEAWASFLMTFKPLFLAAEVGVSISVGIDIHIGLIHISFGATLGADLFLAGPPFGGWVSVDFRIVHVTIQFGASNPQPAPLSLEQFVSAVRKAGLTDAPPDGAIPVHPEAADAPDAKTKPDLAVLALSAGAATEAIKQYAVAGGSDDWFVRAGQFRFRVESKVALREAVIKSDWLNADGVEVTVLTQDIRSTDAQGRGSPHPVYARLTKLASEMASTLTVSVVKPNHVESRLGNEWRVLPILKKVPAALWAQYDPAQDPTPQGGGANNYIESILNAGSSTNANPTPTTIQHLVGYIFVPPPPSLSPTNFPTFDAVGSMSEGVFQQAQAADDHNATTVTIGSSNARNPLIVPPPPSSGKDKDPAVDKRPRLPWSAPVDDTPDAAAAAGTDPLDTVRTAWKNGGGDADGHGMQMVADWVSGAFGWAPPPNGGGVLLRTTKPVGLLGEGVDDFAEYYMSCPFVTAM